VVQYIYGIDLAESLNFFACWILYPQDGHIRVRTVKKAKNVLYPTLVEMFTNPNTGLFKKYPPSEIWTDYTNEKSFTEFMETHFNPAFANPHSKKYKKWTIMHPVVSSQPMNLQMKQNMAQMLQSDENGFTVFEFPDPKKTRPETGVIIAEAKEQTLREAAVTNKAGSGMMKATFPKPTGYDNDLIRALELGALGARKYATSISNLNTEVTVKSTRIAPKQEMTERKKWGLESLRRMQGFNITGIDVHLPDD
jgi:hypothetical protein